MKSLRLASLPSATVFAERLCFHRCLSVHRRRCTPPRQTPLWQSPHPVGRHPPGRYPHPLDRQPHPLGWHPVADTPLGRHCPPWADTPPRQTHPPPHPSRQPPQRTVRILLECILVFMIFYYMAEGGHKLIPLLKSAEFMNHIYFHNYITLGSAECS